MPLSNTFRSLRKADRNSNENTQNFLGGITADRRLSQSTLVLELTAVCNAKCPGCFPQYLDLPQGFFDLPAAKESLVAYAKKGGKVVCFTARGEPLLDKRIPDVVKFAKDLGIEYVEFTSNAQLLSPDMSRRLIESGLDTLRISMTGTKQAVYEKWQGFESSFHLNEVEANVLRFIAIRNEMGRTHPQVFTRYIYDGTKDNDDAFAYIKKWAYVVNDVQVTLRLPVIKNGKALQVKNPEDIPSFFSSGEGKIRCPSINPVGGAFAVTSEGNVSICNSALGEPSMTVGNIVNESFDDVVDNYFAAMNSINNLMNKGVVEDLPAPCQSCFGLVEAGNNCQDVDLLQLMTTCRILDEAAALTSEEPMPIVIFGATTAAKMLLLNHDFRENVSAVIDNDVQLDSNSFALPDTLKGIPIKKSLPSTSGKKIIIVIADDDSRIETDKIKSTYAHLHHVLCFSDTRRDVNAETFKLPNLDDVYDVPWAVWHTQTQQNFYLWYLISYLKGLHSTIAISIEEYYKVDKLLQIPDILEMTSALIKTPGATSSSQAELDNGMRGRELLPLEVVCSETDGTVFLAWTNDEADIMRKSIGALPNGHKHSVISFEELIKKPKYHIAFAT